MFWLGINTSCVSSPFPNKIVNGDFDHSLKYINQISSLPVSSELNILFLSGINLAKIFKIKSLKINEMIIPIKSSNPTHLMFLLKSFFNNKTIKIKENKISKSKSYTNSMEVI